MIMKKFWDFVGTQDAKRLAQQGPAPGITECVDIPYIDDGDVDHQLDVYYPEGTQGTLPVIVEMHGGGWMYGNKELNKFYATFLAARGFTVVNINYRLSPKALNDEQLFDVMSAFDWTYKNIENYHGDLSRVYVTGDSAGGQLAAYSSIINSSDKLSEIFGVKRTDLKIRAVGLTSPVSFMTKKPIYYGIKATLGRNYKDKPYGAYCDFDKIIDLGTMPPAFLVTSTGDYLANAQTHRLYKLLEERNISSKFIYWKKYKGKNLPHVFSVIEPESAPGIKTIDEMIAFFKRH